MIHKKEPHLITDYRLEQGKPIKVIKGLPKKEPKK